MDSLANLADNQTDLVDILPDGEARASASSLSLAPADVSSPTYKRQTETATDPPGRVNHPMSHTGKTAASLSGISENHPQEDVSEFGSLSTVPPSLKGRLCVEDEMNTEPILGAWDCPQTVSGSSVHNHIGSRGPKSSLVDKPPHIADGLSSTSVLSYPTQENGTSESHKKTLVISNSLTEQSLSKEVGQTPDNSGHLRPLSGLSSGLTLSDTVMEPLSELYIFESETQDSLFTPQNHSSGIQTCSADHPSVSQQGDRNTHTLSHPSSEEVLTQSQNQLSMTSDSDGVDSHSQLCQNIRTGESTREGHAGNYTSVFDVSQGEAEVRDLSSHARLSDSPNELWLDACQYLTSEDNGNGNDVLPTIFDKWGNSVLMAEESASRDSSCPLWDTKASGYLPEEGDGIGWSGGDTRGWGQPVERWSSVDSWASALSDWAAIITAPPVEITAAFTEIGAEIDALTQALADSETETSGQTAKQTEGQEESRLQSQTRPPMAIQDQELEPQNRQETSIQGRKSCLSWSLTEPTKVSALTELEDREATKPEVSFLIATAGQENKDAEQTKSTQGECSLRPLATQSSLTPSRDMLNSPGDVPRASSPAASDDMATDLTQFAGYADGMDTDSYLSKKEESIFLHITEEVDGDLEGEEPCRDGVYKVTEEKRALGRHELALRDSCLSETPAVGRARGAGSAPSGDLSFSDAETPTSAHVPAVDATSGLCPNSDQHVSKGTLLSEVHNSEPARGRPRFIMPLAPLVIGPPLFRRANIALEGDQDSKAKKFFNDNHGHSCPRTQAHVPLPTLEGITGHLPLEGHKEKQSINDNSATNDLWSRGDNFASITSQGICDLGRELSNLVSGPGDRFLISPKDRVAVFTLDLDDPLFQEATKAFPTPPPEHTGLKMPHKTHKSGSDLKTRPKKEKPAAFHPASQTPVRQESLPRLVPVTQAAKKHESHPHLGGINTKRDSLTGPEGKEDGPSAMINPVVVSEKVMAKSHGKKKKKHSQNATVLNKEVEPLIKEESGAKQKAIKGKTDFFEDKLGTKAGSSKEKIMGVSTKNDSIQAESVPKKSQHPDGKACPRAAASCGRIHKELQPADSISQLNDDVIKRRRLSKNKFGKILGALEKKLTQTEGPAEAKRDEPSAAVATTRKKAYSEVVKQKTCKPQEDPKVMQAVQAAAVSGDPQSLCLWCQFSTVFVDHTATWSRDGTALAELKRSAGDESRVSLNISRASHKDLGKYQCRLNTPHGAVTLDYLLTYEVLSEIVIPASPKNIPSAAPVEIVGNEEDVHCSSLLFRDDFLTEQFFGENQPASIITEKVHFGEGMHRRAFRTKLQAGLVPQLSPGHHCVLKVHNAISHGTKNNEELVQRNFSLAVEECHVQNTAREYIKAYTAVAQSAEAFGDVPEIIPIYLVHRPSNDIPYATLEEELFGDFVKYSVRDGKEINVMRRESEAGQKCCAFQHWVYHRTEGNLLVTDMQGVGMRLTDVGIATCKKGHKGFKGNCATSFIDQFKVLHQCNKYCEILGLKSLQPKPKKTVSGPKGKPQPSTPRKTFGPTVKGKS